MADNDVQIKIKGDISDFQDALAKSQTHLAGFSKSLISAYEEQEKVSQDAANSIKNGSKEGENAVKGLSVATAGATREFIVLGHEALTGNFSRIPGSLLVLAERTSGLSTILGGVSAATLGWGAVIGITLYGIYNWIEAQEELNQAIKDGQGNLQNAHQSTSMTSEDIKTLIVSLQALGNLSRESSAQVVNSFLAVVNMSADLKARLISITPDFAAVVKKDAPEASKELIKMFEDPIKGADELSRIFRLNANDLQNLKNVAQNGGIAEAQETLFNMLQAKATDYREKEIGAWEKFRVTVNALIGGGQGGNANNDDKMEVGNIFNQVLDNARNAILLTGETAKKSGEVEEAQNKINDAIVAGNAALKSSGTLTEQRIRLQGELNTLQKAADAEGQGGNVKQQQQFLQAAEEVQEKINNLGKQKPDNTDENNEIAIEKSDLQTKLELYNLDLENKRETDAAKVASGKMSQSEQLRDLQTFAAQQYLAGDDEIAKEMELWEEDSAGYEELLNKKKILAAKYNNEVAKMNEDAAKQAAEQTKKEYDQLFNGIKSASDTMVNGILQGTQTWQQATGRLLDNLGIKFADMAVKDVLDWTEKQAMKLGISETIHNELIALGLESAAQQKAQDVAVNTAKINADAALTFAGVTANLAPTMGPAATGPAATTAASVMAVIPQASLDVGTANVPSDMLANIHAGEMVIPKSFSDSIRSGDIAFGSSGGGGDNYSININVSAIDTQSGANFLKQNSALIAQQVVNQQRLLNPNMNRRN